MTGTLFTNVEIFDGSGAARFPGEVLVRGDRIEAVARRDERLDRSDVMVIDGHGATLMPGMVEDTRIAGKQVSPGELDLLALLRAGRHVEFFDGAVKVPPEERLLTMEDMGISDFGR